jgi:hypothetical protein
MRSHQLYLSGRTRRLPKGEASVGRQGESYEGRKEANRGDRGQCCRLNRNRRYHDSGIVRYQFGIQTIPMGLPVLGHQDHRSLNCSKHRQDKVQ